MVEEAKQPAHIEELTGADAFEVLFDETRSAIKTFWKEQHNLQKELGLVEGEEGGELTEKDIENLASALTTQLVIRNMSLITAGAQIGSGIRGDTSVLGAGAGVGAGLTEAQAVGAGQRRGRRVRR